jgi:minor histocompatibility antigen H13
VGRFLPKSFQRTMGWEYKIAHPLPEFIAGPSPLDLSMDFTGTDIVAFIFSAGICGAYVMSKKWYLNNILGVCFCLQGIERFSLGSYKIGATLLVGLFFYDIFWVFGTEVMVTVAKSLDGVSKQRGRRRRD